MFGVLCPDASCSLFLLELFKLVKFLQQNPFSVLSVCLLCSSPEKVFYTDDRQGRASETGQSKCVCVCECLGGDAEGEKEGEKVKESATAALLVYLPLLSYSYKSNRTESVLALCRDTDHWHTERCQNHLDG